MVEAGWKTHVLGEGRQFASAKDAIETYRAENPGKMCIRDRSRTDRLTRIGL